MNKSDSKVLYIDKTTTILLKNNIITKIYTYSLKNEANIQNIAANLNIAPKVYKVDNNLMEMEYIEGPTLDQYLKRAYIDKNNLKYLLRKAIDILYDNGILHNDLTGNNIIITGKENIEIKIIDYGHAKLFDEPVPKRLRDYGIIKNF